MAANIFGRYVWLIDQLRRYKGLTGKEINKHWEMSGLSYGKGDTIPRRTLNNHRKAIFDIFNISIECDKKNGYKYYIDEPEALENDKLRCWLIDSYSMLNQINCDKKMEGRIVFEEVPSGNTWLTTITDAMRSNKILNVSYKSFNDNEPRTFYLEPYYLKVVKRRWYLIARNNLFALHSKKKSSNSRTEYRKENLEFAVYALDRMENIEVIESSFAMKKDFDLDNFFKGCMGVITWDEDPIKVVVRAKDNEPNYLRTLPLHESQKELKDMEKDGECYFEYEVCPTYEFYQAILSHTDQLEVISPEPVRQRLLEYAKNLTKYYEK